ncbi:MAG: GGDEF domain-containing protein, partial [Candidatus Omnitrophica bacterium]|nr:GGDEF domain-containing protein [Candidatus Omnitrophota bacterium]
GLKRGSVFERWVLKNVQTLIVKHVRKDYRFSFNEEEEDDFVSLISKPLVREGNVIGILRIDSTSEDAFSQHDLRILDIIGGLTSVALENAELYKKTEELAIKDSLTGAYVHRYFMERLEEEIKRGLRSGGTFALFMIDIDNFKKFNDLYGHVAGDLILQKVSDILIKRPSDRIFRYGGEEFTFLKLNIGAKEAAAFGESIREEIEKSTITFRREKKSVTVSIGVAIFPDDAKLREDVIWEADRRLYQAKSGGKNRICIK